jgi:hypothetical protein
MGDRLPWEAAELAMTTKSPVRRPPGGFAGPMEIGEPFGIDADEIGVDRW